MDTGLVLIFIIGFVVGIFSGLLGIGGGILIIPALMYLPPLFNVVALPIKEATGMAATQALASGFSSSWVHYRKGNLLLGLVLLLAITAVIGGYLGGLTSGLYPDLWLKLAYLIALAFVIVLLVWPPGGQRAEEAPIQKTFAEVLQIRHIWIAVGLCLLVGYMAGLLGIGGAIFLVPIMYSLLRLPTLNMIGSSAGVVALIGISTFIGKLQGGIIPLTEALVLTVGAVIGGVLGARLSSHIPGNILRMLFIALMIASFARMALEFL